MPPKLTLNSPIDGSLLFEGALTAADELPALGQRARDAFRSWRKVPLSNRKAICTRWCDLLVQRKEELGRELTLQMGRPIKYSPNELVTAATRARYMIHNAEKYLCPVDVSSDDPVPLQGFKRYLKREPIGVSFVISPFNYPWLVAVNAIIPALLAGNSVVLKHSPLTPLVGLRFAELFVEAGLPENVLQAVQMDPSTADLFVRSPEVDSVSFTGSVATGKLVNKAAADAGKLINVNLELGGNDPAYIRADADLSDAVENVIDGVVFNSGQSCCAVERIYVHEKVFEEFVKRAVETVEGYTLSDPLDGQTTLGPMTSEPLAAKVWEHIADALAKGANQLVDLSKFPKDKEGSVWIAPRIFVGLDNEMKIMSEETFGPVVGIVKVSSDEEAVRLMNDSCYGLTASIWTRDIACGESLGDELETGTVYVNRCDYGDPGLLWTGVKDSGRSGTMGRFGWDAVTRVKSVHVRIPANPPAASDPAPATAVPTTETPKGDYIVVFKKGTSKEVVDKAIAEIEAAGGTLQHRYDSVFTGFAASIPDSLLGTMHKHPQVDYVEADGTVTALARKLGI